MNVSPYLLLKNSIAKAISRQAGDCYAKWAASWKIDLEGAQVCAPATPAMAEFFLSDLSDSSNQRHLQNGSTAWFHIPDALKKELEQSIFGLSNADATTEKGRHSALAGKVLTESLDELINAVIGSICQLEVLPETAIFPPPAHLFRPGSGALVCELSVGHHTLRILLPAAAVSHWRKPLPASPKPGLMPLKAALKNTPVSLHVEVSDAELTLGYLATLAIGDVLKLPNKLDHTLRVLTDDNVAVCNAHLGSCSGALAIELVKSN